MFPVITRSYNRTMYYFRALRTADAILESLLTLRLTHSCTTTIMKMSHCAQCAGYHHQKYVFVKFHLMSSCEEQILEQQGSVLIFISV